MKTRFETDNTISLMKQRLEPYNGFKTYYTWWLWFYDIYNWHDTKELYENYEKVYEDVDALAEALYDRYEDCTHPEFVRDGIDWYDLSESVSELIKEYVDELSEEEEEVEEVKDKIVEEARMAMVELHA